MLPLGRERRGRPAVTGSEDCRAYRLLIYAFDAAEERR
jgi:hypothetical protein